MKTIQSASNDNLYTVKSMQWAQLEHETIEHSNNTHE